MLLSNYLTENADTIVLGKRINSLIPHHWLVLTFFMFRQPMREQSYSLWVRIPALSLCLGLCEHWVWYIPCLYYYVDACKLNTDPLQNIELASERVGEVQGYNLHRTELSVWGTGLSDRCREAHRFGREISEEQMEAPASWWWSQCASRTGEPGAGLGAKVFLQHSWEPHRLPVLPIICQIQKQMLYICICITFLLDFNSWLKS